VVELKSVWIFFIYKT